jgi:hypothetical protein
MIRDATAVFKPGGGSSHSAGQSRSPVRIAVNESAGQYVNT